MLRVAPGSIEEAQTVFSGLGLKGSNKWVAFVPDGRPGREVSRDLLQAAAAAGCDAGKIILTPSSLTNVEALTGQVLTQPPDAILLWLDPTPAGVLARGLRKAGFQGRFAGPSRCESPSFRASAAESIEGFVIPGIVPDPQTAARFDSFRKAFLGRFGCEADLTAAQSYDAASLLVQLLRRTPALDLPKAFPLVFSLPGVTGDLSFDKYGNRKVTLRLLAVHEGRFEPVGGGGRNTIRESNR
jgi:ABC-type branched-subunit amino acid transport system substrate-binding protein